MKGVHVIPAVQQAVGASGVWGVVKAVTETYLGEQVDVASHVTRGKSGMLVLAWLAEALPRVGGPGAVAALDDPVRSAAQSWLEASLTLHEHDLPAPARGR